MTTHVITLNQTIYGVPPVIYAVQNDTGRQLEMYLADMPDGLDQTMSAELAILRSDKTIYDIACSIDDESQNVVADMTQALTQAGMTKAQLKIYDANDKIVSTYRFFIEVQPNIDGISVEQDGVSIQELIDDITTLQGKMTTAEDDIDTLETDKQDKLTAGDGIALSGATISADLDATLTSATKPAQAKAVGDALWKYDDLLRVIKITDRTVTMGQMQTTLNAVNTAGDHVVFDVSALGAGMYLCTIFLGTGYYRISDLVTGLTSTGFWESTDLLIDKIEGSASTYKHYTVQWDKTNAQMTRLNDAASITTNTTNFKHSGSENPNYSNPFDDIYPWSGRKLCNIDIDLYRNLSDGDSITECVTAWEGDANFSYTDDYGVWVYTPSFYGRVFEIGNYRYFDVTEEMLDNNIYYPEQITGRYLGVDVTLTIDGTSKHCLLPKVGMPLANVSGTNMHTYANNYGATLIDIYQLDASSLLYLVEYANYNIQNSIGNGISALYVQGLHPSAASSGTTVTMEGLSDANLALFIVGAIIDFGTSDGGNQTGRRAITNVVTSGTTTTVTVDSAVTVTTATFVSIHGGINVADEVIGSHSGYIGANGKVNAYYRGEVLYANKFYYVLGAYRETGTGEIWIAERGETDAYNALDTSVHTDTGLALPTSSNYVKAFGMVSGMACPPFATEVAGNSTNPVGDYVYVPALTTGNTVLWFGGSAYLGATCGFYGDWLVAASYSYWDCGGRPSLKTPSEGV